MRVNPKTEEEVQLMGLLQPGVYNFQVLDATDQVSANGNEMIKLTLKVWDAEGKIHIVFDYLLDAMAYKLRHFAEATGLFDKYNAGNIDSNDCKDRCAKVRIVIQKGKEKNDGSGERYPDKNSIGDYLISKGNLGIVSSSSSNEFKPDSFNDDIPF